MPSGYKEGFRKLGPREAQAISKVIGSYRGCIEGRVVKDFRVSLGSVAPIAVRLEKFEHWILGKTLSPELLDEIEGRIANEVTPIDDIRSTADYRQWVSGRLVRSFVEELGSL